MTRSVDGMVELAEDYHLLHPHQENVAAGDFLMKMVRLIESGDNADGVLTP